MRFAVVLSLLLGFASAAPAVLIDGDDGSGNVAAPPFGDPAFGHVGLRGPFSAVYLGRGIVITANHVGVGDVTLGGVTYPVVPGAPSHRLRNPDGSATDLLLFQIFPYPDLPTLSIAEQRPPWGSFLVIAGNGADRGAPITWDPNGPYPPGPTKGYQWASAHTLRWGTNHVEVYPPSTIFGTEAFGSRFDEVGTLDEAQAVPGDSGGAAFALAPGMLHYQLAGVMIAIVAYGGQPAGTTFHGQTTYYADLSAYREEILDVVHLPEPRGGVWPGLALVAGLARRRWRQPPHQSRLRSSASPSARVPSSPSG